MKTLSKQSKVQGMEAGTRKILIPKANSMSSGTAVRQVFDKIKKKENIAEISLSTSRIKHNPYLYQKPFNSSSATKLGVTQANIPKTGEEAWFLKSTRKLQELENLPANWDSYGANPPNSIALFWGRESLTVLFEMNFPPTQITPSVEEGVGICFIRGKKYADIECFNTGEILAVTSDSQGNPNVWEVNPSREELKNSLQRIRVYLQS